MAGVNPYSNKNNSNRLFEQRNKRKGGLETYSKTADIMNKIVFAILLVVAFYPPFFRGLYFEENQFPTEIIVFATFALFWVSKWLRKDKVFIKTPIEYASFGFVIVYFISLFVSVSLRLATAEWLKYCMYFAVFFMISDLVKTMKAKLIVLWTIVASAVGVSLLGIDGAAGGHIAKIINKFFPPEYPLVFDTFKVDRIYSTLQYPNALASILMAVFFVSVVLIVIQTKMWVKVLGGINSFILLFTFVFTLSRGAFIMFPIILVLFMIFLPKGCRVRGAVFLFIPMIPTVCVSIKMSQYILTPQGNSIRIWMLVLFGAFMTTGLTLIANYLLKWLERLSLKVYAAIIAAVLILGIGAFIVALNIKAPLEIGHSENQPDSNISVMKSAILKPGNDYKLRYSVNASIEGDKPQAYIVNITSRSDRDILLEAYPSVIMENGKATNGTENKEITFKVPENSRVVDIFFSNYYHGTKATFKKSEIIDANTGETVKELTMNYKYLPLSIMSRFEDISNAKSSIERRIFYQDGLKSVKDHWLLGAGGGAWKQLYFNYQSYLYWTTESHNYFLQVAVESGVLGIIILLILLAFIIVAFISEFKWKRTTENGERILQGGIIVAIIALFMHSAVDFDFSLASVFLTMWVLLALFNSRYRNEEATETIVFDKVLINKLFRISDISNRYRPVKVHHIIMVVISISLLMVPVLFYSAMNNQRIYQNALKNGNYDAAYKAINSAANTDIINPDYKIRLANLILEKKQISSDDINTADKAIINAASLSKYSVTGTGSIGGYYIISGKAINDEDRIDKGLKYVESAKNLRPFNPTDWQQLAGSYYDIAMYYFNKGDPEKALGYVDKTLKLIDDAKEINKTNVIPFVFTLKTQVILERLRYVKDNIKKGGNLDISKLVFNHIPDMDIDGNGMPDQWTTSNSNNVKTSYSNGVMIVESSSKQEFIQTHELKFKTGKMYRIEAELTDTQDIKEIPFIITGVNENGESLKHDGNLYTAEVMPPSDFIAQNNFLRIGIQNKLELKSVIIIEK